MHRTSEGKWAVLQCDDRGGVRVRPLLVDGRRCLELQIGQCKAVVFERFVDELSDWRRYAATPWFVEQQLKEKGK